MQFDNPMITSMLGMFLKMLKIDEKAFMENYFGFQNFVMQFIKKAEERIANNEAKADIIIEQQKLILEKLDAIQSAKETENV